jgi:hypothetical protein
MTLRRDRIVWEIRVIVTLVAVSFVLYMFHLIWFRDLHHIWLWSFTSLAFLPISALFVTLLINRVLSARDKALRLDKLNMLIGLFFSRLGNELLLRFSDADPDDQYLRNHFGSPKPWSRLQPKQAQTILHAHRFGIDITRNELAQMKMFLIPHMDFLMRLMENPNLLEHESFTQLQRAVFHLAEELSYREDLESVSDADIQHLCGDIERVYSLITREWVQYMIFLKRNFPYLFSLAVRMNPLDRSASAALADKQPPPAKAAGAPAGTAPPRAR